MPDLTAQYIRELSAAAALADAHLMPVDQGGNALKVTLGTLRTYTQIGLAIGSNVQAWDADLDAIAALAGTSGFLKKTGANTWALDTNTYLTSAPVSSVFGRTGAVVAAQDDYTFAQLASKPTTLSGYGITDAYPLTGNPSGFLTANQTISFAPTGDVTGSTTGSISLAPALAIGATKVTSAMLNADVYSTAHSWGGQQTFTAPILGTPASGVATNLTGTAASLTAGAATVLATARTINGTSFDGGANITVTAAAGTLTGATLNSGVTASSLTSFGASPTIITPSITTGFTIGGVAATGTIPRGNGTNFVASAFTMAAPGTTGNVLTSDGTNWLSSAPAGGGITIGTTTITSGTTTRVLYNNAGVVGEYAVTGSGNAVLSASPTLTGTVGMAAQTNTGTITQTSASATAFESGPNGGTNPVFRLVNSTASQADGVSITGLAAGSGVTLATLSSGSSASLSLNPKGTSSVIVGGGAVVRGANLALVGSATEGANSPRIGLGLVTAAAITFGVSGGSKHDHEFGNSYFRNASSGVVAWASTDNAAGTSDLTLRRAAAANLAFGAADAALPVAQTLSVQNVVTGTSNTAGAAWTDDCSRGTGTGLGGRRVWRTAPAGSTGSTQNALVEACAIESSGTFKLKTIAFSALPTAVANGEMFFCSDGAVTSVTDNTLTSGGSGALAIRINGAWRAFNLQN